MKRKIITLSLILVIVTLVSNVYAVSKCKVDLKTDKSEFNKNDEFTVNVNLSDIQDEKGIIAVGGTLEYDKNSLELVKMEAQGKWTKPSYNEANRKFVTDRDNSYATKDETLFKITFKVKEESKKDITITLKDISASNGKEDIKTDNVSKAITIKDSTVPDTKPGDGNEGNNSGNNNEGNNNGSNNNGSNNGNNVGNNVGNNSGNNSNNNNSIYNNKIPQAGENNGIIIFCIIVLIAIATTYYIKIKIINKKSKREIITGKHSKQSKH